jgi:hypothetical protein
MRSTWRSITIVVLMGLLCVGAGFAALRAMAQSQTPSAAEESATIKDDPTVAPDPKQSADNNVSFPVDI